MEYIARGCIYCPRANIAPKIQPLRTHSPAQYIVTVRAENLRRAGFTLPEDKQQFIVRLI